VHLGEPVTAPPGAHDETWDGGDAGAAQERERVTAQDSRRQEGGTRAAHGPEAVTTLGTSQGEIRARWVINAAGLGADVLDRLFGFDRFTVTPRCGELLVYDKLARPRLAAGTAIAEPRPDRRRRPAADPAALRARPAAHAQPR
jgi:glycine/D-amino acid oxidase-like deaminating enzyme